MRVLAILILISSFSSSAQQNEKQLAYQYFLNGEYKKAINIYDQFSEKNFSITYYSPYFLSLIKMEKYKEAERLARKAANLYPRSLNYKIEIGIAQHKSAQ